MGRTTRLVALGLACLFSQTAFGEGPAGRPVRLPPPQGGPSRIALLAARPVRTGHNLDCAPAQFTATETCFPDPAGPVDRRRYYAGVEFSIVKPRFEDGAEEDRNAEILDYDMALAPRVWVGYLDPAGAGLRTRYWQFHQGSETSQAGQFPVGGIAENMSIEAHTIDLECTQAMEFRHWTLTLATGVRYAIFEQRVDAMGAPDFVMKRFYAVGPTCRLENRMPLWGSRFTFYFTARGSLLVGESRWANHLTSNYTDDVGTVFDMQFGLERHWELRCGRSLFCRAGWEQQHWFGAGTFFAGSPAGAGAVLTIQQDDHDVAFMGYTIALGATW